MTGEWPSEEIDHADNDATNNKWENLRKATRLQNARNLSIKKTNSTGVAGVSFDLKRGKYRARITVNYKERWLGYFTSLEDARIARDKAKSEFYGEFAGA